ncbi:hypothetical protein WJX74_002166 [Apatococcus lobatus]|uniref:Uncharacterized protein n=1 Tax=Apatococcus lobatus TaxID=904363 RepID=A0AAW1QGZ5_9CHLO
MFNMSLPAQAMSVPQQAGRHTCQPRAVTLRRPLRIRAAAAVDEKPAAAKPAPSQPKAAASAPKLTCQVVDGKFTDYRWENGRWTLSNFENKAGNMDWDAVIDAEMARRKILEDNPIASTNEDPVLFDTAEIPWWAWVRRFHLPEAEKANGRAAMVGYAMAFVVDSLSGAGLVDQQNSFLGKLLLHVVVFAILIFRTTDSIPALKGLLDEATFYDKQWKATWEGQERPVEGEKPSSS